MDFPLNSSLILAVTVGLWLLWVAPYVFRRSGLSAAPAAAGMPAPSSTAIRSSITADGLSQQGNIMHNASIRPGNSTGTSEPYTGAPAPVQFRQPVFRIHYGRTALALAGALALALVVIGLPLAAFGVASWWLPVGALAVGGAAIASLRALAVQARRSRVDAAFRAAMSVGRPAPPRLAAPEAPAAEPVRHYPETVLFDAQSVSGAVRPAATVPAGDAPEASVTTAPGAPDRRPTAAELRSAALEVAAKAAPAGPPKTSTTPWEPVAVPKPIYVEAPVASRPAPAPLVLPETPKPAARTPLRAPAESAVSGSGGAPGSGKINLDDVLQRRRA
ncbi:hypothetical protein QNO08_13550 [Arthrobacter sp. zg-Y820]|uniref:hypothetical protein n=1 Tax=unclassified Arthrobacter TaxID=235627 RepID=UPI001E5CF095|nr:MULTISPECIES: hypothetical protein [unclassified Arthrobacter]MCC9195866.1 hypothetical protein [Arthrobacter sp. zg-Y820]MDK1278726.1 hypothetical protein [Arthrobacter sp. zg.Y820]WIB08849.1 hypothetical protein QNO08_13550 [Arthrobacter sp. zg-Y820]